MAVRKGTRGNDNLLGTRATDYLFGDSGRDTINGGDGDDRLFGGEGPDRLLGGNGHDDLLGGGGADTLLGGAGDDFLDGAAGFSTFGEDQDGDLLNGGAGFDEIAASLNDTVIGGTGTDLLHLTVFGGESVRYAVNFANIRAAAPKAVGAAGTPLADTFVGQVERIDAFFGNAAAGSTMFGSPGNDRLEMDTDIDDPGTKGVSIAGSGGDDELRGSDKNDNLNGGAGNDILDGGRGGADTLIGGLGADIYRFELNTFEETIFVDTIRGFAPASELIAINVDLEFEDQKYNFGTEANLLLKTPDPTNGTTDPGIAQLIYDTDSGELFVDANGSDAGGLEQFLILQGAPNITAANILIEYDRVFVL